MNRCKIVWTCSTLLNSAGEITFLHSMIHSMIKLPHISSDGMPFPLLSRGVFPVNHMLTLWPKPNSFPDNSCRAVIQPFLKWFPLPSALSSAPSPQPLGLIFLFSFSWVMWEQMWDATLVNSSLPTSGSMLLCEARVGQQKDGKVMVIKLPEN